MLLADFYATVSDSLKRGTTLDGMIPRYSRMACAWMERNYSFRYMEQYRVLQITAGDRTISLHSNQQIKRIEMIRLIQLDGSYTQLKRFSPRDFTAVETGPSQGFWVAGNHTLVLENIPGEALVGEALFECYSDWPTASGETHPLLLQASDVMLYQVLMMMSPHMRDGRVFEAYKLMRDEALNTLTRAEDEFAHGGVDSSMAYIPFLAG